MMRTTLWGAFALAALAQLASADVEFVFPKAGAKLVGGNSIDVEWKESGKAPAIKDLTTYQLFLCTGGNEKGQVHDLLVVNPVRSTFSATGNKATTTLGKDIGASTPENAYFFRIESVVATGGVIKNYSPRFSLTGMIGSFDANILKNLKSISGTDGPDREDLSANAKPAEPDAEMFDMEYTMQDGPTRYAPMPPLPGTKIVKDKPTPQHPTSAFTIATAFLPTPKAQTTITRSQTFSTESRQNTAAPAPNPSDDMAKFLARWKD